MQHLHANLIDFQDRALRVQSHDPLFHHFDHAVEQFVPLLFPPAAFNDRQRFMNGSPDRFLTHTERDGGKTLVRGHTADRIATHHCVAAAMLFHHAELGGGLIVVLHFENVELHAAEAFTKWNFNGGVFPNEQRHAVGSQLIGRRLYSSQDFNICQGTFD